MMHYTIYGLTVAVAYMVFIQAFKNRYPKTTAWDRLATIFLAIFWPLTVSISTAFVLLGMRKTQTEVVGTSQVAGLAWCFMQPEVPVILSDVHGRHMMKAKHAASKIRGGLSPTAFTVYEDGLWAPMEHQEVAV